MYYVVYFSTMSYVNYIAMIDILAVGDKQG